MLKFRTLIGPLLLAFTGLGVNTCSQQANLTGRHLRNFFGAPVQAISDAVRGNTDGAIEDRYEAYTRPDGANGADAQISFEETRRIACRVNPEDPVPSQDNFREISSQLIEQYCHCSAWGQSQVCAPGPACCSSEACPRTVQCQQFCPNNINILQRNAERARPDPREGNYFSFVNSAFDVFPNRVRSPDRRAVTHSIPSPGYNLGVIGLRRKFNELAFFDARQSEVPAFASDEARKSYYQEKVDAIFENKPTKIPGYANLAQFSADPLVQHYIKQRVADEWLEKTARRGLSEETADPDNPMNQERGHRLLTQVSTAIAHTGSATMTFGYKTGDGPEDEVPVQALEAYHVYEQAPNQIICVHDPNLPVGSMIMAEHEQQGLHFPFSDPPGMCMPYVKVEPNGKTTYAGKMRELIPPEDRVDEDGIAVTETYRDVLVERELFDAKHFGSADRRDTVNQIPRLREFCLEEYNCVAEQ